MLQWLLVILCCFHFLAFGAEKIIFIGDSLTEGYGIEQKYAYPALIQEQINKENLDYKVLNGGVSGSTTASGKSRLKWFLKSTPKIIVVALGANDGLRGIKIEESEKNLSQIIELAQKNNIKVLLVGMQMPPNYGLEYRNKFKRIYPRLAKKYKIALVPFIIEGVAGKKEYNIQDNIHPNKEGHKIISKTVYKYLKELL